jgi:hypothetical protein
MSSVVISGDTSGTVTLTVPAVAGTNTITVPANTGIMVTTASSAVVTQAMLGTNVAGTGPAFSATNSSQQNITASTFTKILFQTENFDTNNNFASSTFTPTVAGYYQITASLNHNYSTSGGSLIATCIYKNGSSYQITANRLSSTQGPYGGLQAQALVYCNGSTDYIDVYAFANNVGPQVATSDTSGTTNFSGVLVRSA